LRKLVAKPARAAPKLKLVASDTEADDLEMISLLVACTEISGLTQETLDATDDDLEMISILLAA